MKMVKKILTLTLSGVLALGLLAGCSSGEKKQNVDNGKKTEGSSVNHASEGTADNSDEVELTMYVVGDRPAKQDEVDANLNKLLKEKMNTTLKINWISWAEYANKYPLLFSSGEEFDMAYCATWLNFSSMASKGSFMSLNELWPKFAPNNFAKTSDEAKQQATVDGQYYCIPQLRSTFNDYGFIYRKDIMDGLNWDGKMETFEDIEKYMDLVKEKYPEMEPLDISSSGNLIPWTWLYSHGQNLLTKGFNGLIFDPSEEHPQLKPIYEMNDLEGLLKMVNRWNEKGFFSKSALSDTDTVKTLNGKAAVKIDSLTTYRDYSTQTDFEFGYSNFMKDIAHQPYTQDCMVISNTAKNPERAMQFWELLTEDEEVFRAFYYGVEGQSYVVQDGQYKITDSDLYATSSMYAAQTDGLTLLPQGTPDDYQTLMEGFEEQIVSGKGNEKYTGFVFNTSSIETEVANVTNVLTQYMYPLCLGYTEPVAGLEEFKTQMKAAGIEKVQQVAQEQLDAYIEGLDQ